MTTKNERQADQARKFTVLLPRDLDDALRAEQQKLNQQTGLRVSLTQVAERAIRQSLLQGTR